MSDAQVKSMKKSLKTMAKKRNIILKPISNALLRTMKFSRSNPLSCDTSNASKELKKGRRAKPFQKRFYSESTFTDLVQKIVVKTNRGVSMVCGENVDDYLNAVMCLSSSDQTRGVVALRLDSDAEGDYKVMGVAFYNSMSSSTKYSGRTEGPSPSQGNASDYWKKPLEWKGPSSTAMNNENYGEIDLVCSTGDKVGQVLIYYALYDMFRQKKSGAQRYNGVMLSTASRIGASDVRNKSMAQILDLQKREMEGKIANVPGLGKYYAKFGFKHVKAVHRGTNEVYWSSSEKYLPSYYMVLRGAPWNSLPTKMQQAATGMPQSANRRDENVSYANTLGQLCSKGERGNISAGPKVITKYTDEWDKRVHVRNTAKWANSRGGRGAQCLK